MDELLEGESMPTPGDLHFANVTFSDDLIPRLQHRFDNLDIQSLYLWRCTFTTTWAFRTFLSLVSSQERLGILYMQPPAGIPLSQLELMAESFDTECNLPSLFISWNGPYQGERIRQAFRRLVQLDTRLLQIELIASQEAQYAPLFQAIQEGRNAVSSHTACAIILSVSYQNTAGWDSLVSQVCRTEVVDSLTVDDFILDNESSGSLTRLISESPCKRLDLEDCIVRPSLSAHRIEELTSALSRTTTLECLSLRLVGAASGLTPALFAILPAMQSLRILEFSWKYVDGTPDLLETYLKNLAKHLPDIQVLMTLETRWCPGFVEALLPGLQKNLSLTAIRFGAIHGIYQPSDEELEPLTRLLTRNRLYHHVVDSIYKSTFPEILRLAASVTAADEFDVAGTALYHLVRHSLPPHSASIAQAAQARGDIRPREEEDGEASSVTPSAKRMRSEAGEAVGEGDDL
jgi:hypothetical protein